VQLAHVFRAGLAEALVPAACRDAGVPHLVETNIFGRVDASDDERQFDCHLFVGKMCALRYRQRLGLAGADFHRRHRVLHWAVDIARLRALAPARAEAKERLGLDPARPVVGRVGRDDDTKWRRLLVDTVPHLLRLMPDAQVMFVGATPATVARLRRLGVLSRVHLIDTTFDEAGVATRFAACDVFATAAEIGESYSVAIAEAMALGLPVRTCSTPWVDNGQIEQVQEGVTGHIADHPRVFGEAVASLLSEPRRARAFGEAAMRQAEMFVDKDRLTRQLERLYSGLVRGSGPPADWVPSPGEVDAFEAEYRRRLHAGFRPLSAREQVEVGLERRLEQLRWAIPAARTLDRHQLAFGYWTVRAKLAGGRGSGARR
jgi:glycosyltransferase involved in cell wall biosynthesis